MSDRIGNESDAAFPGNLLHNLCFSDSRRAHKKDRSLTDRRDPVLTKFVFCKICFYRISDLLFCSFDIHDLSSPCISSSVITSFMAQAGMSTSSGSCSINTNAVRYGGIFAGKIP